MSVYTAKRMRVKITVGDTEYTLGVVEAMNIELLREGGVESKYGKSGTRPYNRHKVGMKRARFTIRHWYKADTIRGDILYDLHNNNVLFDLDEYITSIIGNFVGVKLVGCMSYNYRLVTGGPNDILGEEITGECGTLGDEDLWSQIAISITTLYSYCWYDTCDSLTAWTAPPEITMSLDTVDKQQGDASIKFVTNGTGTGCSRLTTHCNYDFGFWLKVNFTGTNGRIYVMITNNDADQYYAMLIIHKSAVDGLCYITYETRCLAGTNAGNGPMYTNNTWIWVEFALGDPINPNTFNYYVNGVHCGIGLAATMFTATQLHFHQSGGGWQGCTAWLDFCRWHSVLEYPPTYQEA